MYENRRKMCNQSVNIVVFTHFLYHNFFQSYYQIYCAIGQFVAQTET
jgi:hypothetical protein